MTIEELSQPLPGATLPYRPPTPSSYNPGIGLIGCGSISKHHLAAYRDAGFDVRAFADLDVGRAEERRDEYYPDGDVYSDVAALLARDDIEVVDIATHPAPRVALIEQALRAGKHVLSQKPFVLDLEDGERLVGLAAEQGVHLAVNQNGRWAPHVAYLRLAVAAGMLGEIRSVQLVADFDHEWVVGTPFDDIHDLILYDYAIHWFDMLTCYLDGESATSVTASAGRAPGQQARPPLLAQVMVTYPHAQAAMTFNGATPHGTVDMTVIVGTEATARSVGPGIAEQTVAIHTGNGVWKPDLVGSWYDDGFRGAMGELLCAIEENRMPYHHAGGNLASLELCFAAIASSRDGRPRAPGEVSALPGVDTP